MVFFAAFTAAVAFATGTAITVAAMRLVSVFRIWSPRVLKSESLGVDEAAVDARPADVSFEDVCHRRRTADVDVALPNVGHELAKMRGRQKPGSVVGHMIAGDEKERDPATACKRLELVSEYDVVVTQHAVDHDRAALHVLHQRTDRRDSDPARDQQDLPPAARVGSEDAERPFREDARARSDRSDLPREVSERLDRDSKRLSVRCA